MPDTFIVCEPQCTGLEHSVFNAALLETVLLAYPEAQVIFKAEPEHIRWVKQNFSRHASPGNERVQWTEMVIPPRTVGGFRRVPLEWGWCRGILREARASNASAIIFSSLTDSGIIVLKTLLLEIRLRVPVIAVIHSIINALLDRSPLGILRYGKGLRLALAMPHPPTLRYLLLGESLLRELGRVHPRMAARSIGLDHPYLWPARPATKETIPAGRPRFGFFGVSSEKGFATFFDLAKDLGKEFPEAEFEFVGYLNSDADRAMYAGKLINISTTPLTPEEYSRRANGVTYGVFTTDPERYRLCASSSFLDMLSYVKPGICLSNLYIDHNFQRMGDIGYLCQNVAQIRETIASIIRNFPTERYLTQQRNILAGRGVYEPAAVALRLRAHLEGLIGRRESASSQEIPRTGATSTI